MEQRQGEDEIQERGSERGEVGEDEHRGGDS